MTNTLFSDRVILVTGACSGMGKSTAFGLARRGAKAITLFGNRRNDLDEIAREIVEISGSTTRVLVVVGDSSISEDNLRAVNQTIEAFGGITGAFINAGIHGGRIPLSSHEIDEDKNINLKGVIYALRHLLPAIQKTVGVDGPAGSIVVSSSVTAETFSFSQDTTASSISAASRAFLNSLVQTAAHEYGPRVKVNSVMSGVVQTELCPADDLTYHELCQQMPPLFSCPQIQNEDTDCLTLCIGNETHYPNPTLT